MTHTQEHIDLVASSEGRGYDADEPFTMVDDDTYVCAGSATAAFLAAGSLIDLCDAVVTGSLSNGFSVMRPPGHHAGLDGPSGFCLFNNIAVAANVMQERHAGLERILIVDWDVHHGNGTEEIFYDKTNVLFMSIHRGHGFYPATGSADDVGEAPALGYTINVPLPRADMGDSTFIAVFQEVFIPVARAFRPQLILVSAGFDACAGDPLGQMLVSPFGFAKMTSMLIEVCPNIVLALEGGYNVAAISACAGACIRVLMDGADHLATSATRTTRKTRGQLSSDAEIGALIEETLAIHRPYWPCLSAPAVVFAEQDLIAALDIEAAVLIEKIAAMTAAVHVTDVIEHADLDRTDQPDLPCAPEISAEPPTTTLDDADASATLCEALLALSVSSLPTTEAPDDDAQPSA